MSSTITINLRIARRKSEHSEIRIVCPYCSKTSKSFQGIRMHLTRNHSSEIGVKLVKKHASRLWKMYEEAQK